jgi:hypothetical protein
VNSIAVNSRIKKEMILKFAFMIKMFEWLKDLMMLATNTNPCPTKVITEV